MSRTSKAFSLVELLVVVALLSLMLTLAIPAFVSMAQGHGMKRAINSTSDILELARTEAMAKSTWVWVGVLDTTTNAAVQRPEITIAAVASRDGSADTSTTNLMALATPIRINDVSVLSSQTKWAAGATVFRGSSFQFTTTNGKFTDTVIAFSPQGEALLSTNVISPWIEIGLQEKRGAQAMTNKTASIRVSGISGQVVIDY